MKRAGFYKRNGFLAFLLGILILIATRSNVPLLEELEYLVYDAGVRMTYRNPAGTERIAIIAIDDASIDAIGRWPWPRNILANVLDRLAKSDAKAIGVLIRLTEPQTDPGLKYVRQLKSYVEKSNLSRVAARETAEIAKMLRRAENNLDADNQLARSIGRSRNLYVPMFFQFGKSSAEPAKAPPDYVRRNRITKTIDEPDTPSAVVTATSVRYPIKRFGTRSAGVGHYNSIKDATGGVRTETLVLQYNGDFYPSLPLLLAARGVNVNARDIAIEMGKGVRLGRLYINTDSRMRMLSGFFPKREGASAFATYSFHEVLNGRVSPSVFRNKLLLIGLTAAGIGDTYVTPAAEDLAGPQLAANVIASILNQDLYARPDWVMWTEIGIFAAITLYLMFLLPRMNAGMAATVSFFLLLLLLIGGHFLMISDKIWLRSVPPALLLAVGHVLLTMKRLLTNEQWKLEAESDSAHSNRMLGLAFQGQGQLDMALDKFRKLPIDESVLELIYNLALDFERKRQFNKAVAAYEYILRYEDGFRDVRERKRRAQQVDHTIMLGANANSTLVLDAVDQRPTLGRYEIERELGKGAMGTVYLGRDPKINRVVAIKTLALSQEFEGRELDQVKERFFREAETAGRLNHPCIVTIYDAGEEHDLAYIAMEYLEGKDLTHYIGSKKPISLARAFRIIGEVANALDYAHKQKVVHRDIKPANIMYNEKDDSVKVTDFGIARITASSKTKTGVVLGTPSYMSPEQLAGQHVDGCSDLFSLGVTFFEMLTGRQPFTGDSMAALMYQIANAKHPDVTRLRSNLPGCLRAIFDRLLHKNPNKRYQSGDELRQALVKCLGPAADKERKER